MKCYKCIFLNMNCIFICIGIHKLHLTWLTVFQARRRRSFCLLHILKKGPWLQTCVSKLSVCTYLGKHQINAECNSIQKSCRGVSWTLIWTWLVTKTMSNSCRSIVHIWHISRCTYHVTKRALCRNIMRTYKKTYGNKISNFSNLVWNLGSPTHFNYNHIKSFVSWWPKLFLIAMVGGASIAIDEG